MLQGESVCQSHYGKIMMELGYYILVLGIIGNVQFSSCENICRSCTRSMSTSGFSPAQRIITSQYSGSYYYSGDNYYMTISADSAYGRGFIVTFRTIDTRPDHTIEIYDGNGRPICFKSGYNVIVNKESSSNVCTVLTSTMYIRWITDPSGTHYREKILRKGFELTVTVYENTDIFGRCYANRFKCHNLEDRCIYKGLVCNGRNNCGNLEDERGCNRVGVIVGSIVGCLAVIAFICGLVLFMRRRRVTTATVIRTNVVPPPVQPNTYIPPPMPQPYPASNVNTAYPQQQYPAANQNFPNQQSPYPDTGFENKTYNAPYPATMEAPPPYSSQNPAPYPVQNRH